jgi:hypothetical protein
MTLPSSRLPFALILGATLMAWRATKIAPLYSRAESEMFLWAVLGAVVMVLCLFWELVRWYQRMDRRFVAE